MSEGIWARTLRLERTGAVYDSHTSHGEALEQEHVPWTLAVRGMARPSPYSSYAKAAHGRSPLRKTRPHARLQIVCCAFKLFAVRTDDEDGVSPRGGRDARPRRAHSGPLRARLAPATPPTPHGRSALPINTRALRPRERRERETGDNARKGRIHQRRARRACVMRRWTQGMVKSKRRHDTRPFLLPPCESFS
jgi:hypothetical protein